MPDFRLDLTREFVSSAVVYMYEFAMLPNDFILAQNYL